MDWDGVEPERAQQQRQPARGFAGAREDHGSAARQLVQHIRRVAVLVLCRNEQVLLCELCVSNADVEARCAHVPAASVNPPSGISRQSQPSRGRASTRAAAWPPERGKATSYASCGNAVRAACLGRHRGAEQLRPPLGGDDLRDLREHGRAKKQGCDALQLRSTRTFRILSMSSSKSRLRMRSASSSTRCCSVRRLNPCSVAPQAVASAARAADQRSALPACWRRAATRLGVGQVVRHTAGRAHDDVRPLSQRDCLRHDVDAAHQRGRTDADGGAQRLELRGVKA